MDKQQTVNRVYDDVWKSIVEKDGNIDYEQIKRELYDFYVVMLEVSEVYMEISNNRFSKPRTPAIYVLEEHRDRIREAIEDMQITIDDLIAQIKDFSAGY